MTKTTLFAALGTVTLSLAACDSPGIAFGDANSIVAAMSPDLWETVSDDVFTALEPTIRTVRDEKTFTVTFQDPEGEYWSELRRFRQILLVGTETELRVVEALEKASDPINGPGIYQIKNVWSIGQTVTLVLLAPGAGAEGLMSHLPAINELLDGQYRKFVINRMYIPGGGVDSALADTLYTEAGFQLLLPKVYDWEHHDSVYIFRNDNPDPSDLIRQIAVTWKTPIPADMQPEGILAWRDSLAAANYSEPQVTVTENSNAHPFDFRGWFAYEIQAEWKNPPDRGWPAGGPLIARAIVCENQNRMYLLDSWLYAPGKEKYEYMIQLETILNSFKCGSA
ncbi:MAG: DUF4837 family protein [Gemmatimonadetes bacterium]|nr:DUF4837 family protein [Gemmatimonadota bacterium]